MSEIQETFLYQFIIFEPFSAKFKSLSFVSRP